MEDVGDVVLADHHLGWVEVDDVLVVTFGFAQGVVAVDVLSIGQGGVAGCVDLGLLHVGGGVALRPVVVLVSFEDAGVDVVAVPFRRAEVVVVVARRVVVGLAVGSRAFAEAIPDEVQVGVFKETALIRVAEAVVADILILAGVSVVAEGADEILQGGYAAPDGGVDVFHNGGGGQAVLVELAPVAEDVFGDVAEVDVEFAGVVLVFLIGEGVHQPELDIFDVGGLKVDRLHLAHDARPTAARVVEFAVGVDTGGVGRGGHVIVVWAAFLGIVGEVEHRHIGLGACGNVLHGENLGFQHLTDAVLRKFLVVDVRRTVVGVAVVEYGVVDDVPRQFRAVLAVVEPRSGSGLGEEVVLVLGRAGHIP